MSELSLRIRPLDAYLAAAVEAPETRVTQLATPFFERGAVFLITARTGSRPLLFTVGLAEPDFAVLLESDAEAFGELAARAGVRLETPGDRAAYAGTFLAATRAFDRTFTVVHSVDDIVVRPSPSEEAAARFAEMRAAHGAAIEPPTLSDDAPWLYRLFALRGRELVRIELTLHRDGRVTTREAVLARALPVAYTL